MGKTVVTTEELKDENRVWTSDELFGMTNAELQTIHAVRNVEYSDNDTKRVLVKNLVDAGVATDSTAPAADEGNESSDGESAAASLTKGTDELGFEEQTLENEGGLTKTEPYSAGAVAGGELDEKAAAEAAAQRSYDALYGSSVQPSTFTLNDGTVLQLGEVVRRTQEASGLSELEWNKLDDESREEYIAAAVGQLDVAKTPEEELAEKGLLHAGTGNTLSGETTDGVLSSANGAAAVSQDVTDARLKAKGPALLSNEHDRPAEEVLKPDAHVVPTELSTHTLHGHIDDLKSVV